MRCLKQKCPIFPISNPHEENQAQLTQLFDPVLHCEAGLTRFVRRHKLPLLPVSLGSDGTHPERSLGDWAGHGWLWWFQSDPRICLASSPAHPQLILGVATSFVHLPPSYPRTIYLPRDLRVDSYKCQQSSYIPCIVPTSKIHCQASVRPDPAKMAPLDLSQNKSPRAQLIHQRKW